MSSDRSVLEPLTIQGHKYGLSRERSDHRQPSSIFLRDIQLGVRAATTLKLGHLHQVEGFEMFMRIRVISPTAHDNSENCGGALWGWKSYGVP